MTEPTQQQIAQAQAAGDVAYSEALANGSPISTCYDAYRAAYGAMRDEQEANDTIETPSGWFPSCEQRIESATPLAEAQMDRYNEYRAGLSPASIALMEAMTRETASEPPAHDGMWK